MFGKLTPLTPTYTHMKVGVRKHDFSLQISTFSFNPIKENLILKVTPPHGRGGLANMTFLYSFEYFVQFLVKNIWVDYSHQPTPCAVGIARHGFSIQYLTFDVISSKNVLVNWPLHSSPMRTQGFTDMEVLCADLDILCTFHQNSFLVKQSLTALSLGWRISKPEFCAFLDNSCHIHKYFLVNLAPTFKGKNFHCWKSQLSFKIWRDRSPGLAIMLESVLKIDPYTWFVHADLDISNNSWQKKNFWYLTHTTMEEGLESWLFVQIWMFYRISSKRLFLYKFTPNPRRWKFHT